MQLTLWQKIKTVFWVVFTLAMLTYLAHSWGASWPMALSLAMVIYAILFLWSFCGIIKKQALAGMPVGMQMVFSRLEDFPQLDRDLFNKKIHELLSCGFVGLADFTLTSEDGKAMPVFGRVLVHHQHACFAEVGQVFPPNLPPLPLGCVIMSSFESEKSSSSKAHNATSQPSRNLPIVTPPSRALNGHSAPIPDPGAPRTPPASDDRDWSLSTTDRTPDNILWALRNPRKLVSRHPDALASQLLEIHLSKRREMEDVLDVDIARDLSWENYHVRMAMSSSRMRRRMENINPLRFFYEWKWSRPPMEWWGEYSRLQKKRDRKKRDS